MSQTLEYDSSGQFPRVLKIGSKKKIQLFPNDKRHIKCGTSWHLFPDSWKKSVLKKEINKQQKIEVRGIREPRCPYIKFLLASVRLRSWFSFICRTKQNKTPQNKRTTAKNNEITKRHLPSRVGWLPHWLKILF